jgi:hypothetical protein
MEQQLIKEVTQKIREDESIHLVEIENKILPQEDQINLEKALEDFKIEIDNHSKQKIENIENTPIQEEDQMCVIVLTEHQEQKGDLNIENPKTGNAGIFIDINPVVEIKEEVLQSCEVKLDLNDFQENLESRIKKVQEKVKFDILDKSLDKFDKSDKKEKLNEHKITFNCNINEVIDFSLFGNKRKNTSSQNSYSATSGGLSSKSFKELLDTPKIEVIIKKRSKVFDGIVQSIHDLQFYMEKSKKAFV